MPETSSNKASNADNAIIMELSQLLASTYVIYVKTQNFHWNISGSNFLSLHKFFEDQYEELAEAIDLLAEQIRMLNGVAPGSLSEFVNLSKIADGSSASNPDAILEALLVDHKLLLDLLLSAIEVSKTQQDDLTQDLLIGRARSHQKTIWILKQLYCSKISY